MTDDIGPRDAIEVAFTQSIIDQTWTIQRWWRIERSLLARPAPNDMARAVSAGDVSRFHQQQWRDDQPQDRTRTSVTDTLLPVAINQAEGQPARQRAAPRRNRRAAPSETDPADERTVLLTAFQKYGASLELIIRLRTRAEAQRDAAIRDLERYRGFALRNAVHRIEDAEFTEIIENGVTSETGSEPAQRAEKHRPPQSGRTRSRKPKRA